jgi:prophage regulatory protein
MVLPNHTRVVRMRELTKLTGLARSRIYQMQAEGQFPRGIKLGARSVGWIELEVLSWIEQRMAARDG